ncbi:MAG: hypothetical protein GXO74_11135 [Calditrichaeota bacterium]|nr:hypothetical protein [Calditrichota bacterium]
MKVKTHFVAISISLMFILVTIFSTNCQSQKSNQKKQQTKESKQMVSQDTSKTSVQVFNFEKCEVGKLPVGWETAMTGRGTLGHWEIAVDKTKSGENKVLAQTSMKNFGYHFNMAVKKDSDFKDLILTVKFKAIKGNEDRGGGPVWRYQDANNYYICRANPLENNFRVYAVIDGNRRQLKSYSLPITSGEWHTIKIEHTGTHIKCYFDSHLYLEADDSTFTQSGKVGVWTKADSYCYFDDLKIEEK